MSLKDSEEALADYLGEHPYLSSAAGFGQQHTSISLYSASTVVRPPETVVRGRWSAAVGGFVGEELLLNHRRSARDMGMQIGVARFFGHDAVLSAAHCDLRERVDGAIALPRWRKLKSAFTSTVVARRSERAFSGKAATLEELATILWHGQGISGSLPVGMPQDPGAAVPLRNAPSGGGLYPIRVAVIAHNVKGLEPGGYEYQPHSHTLLPVRREPIPLADHLFTADVDLDRVPFALVYLYDFYTNSQKYGDSGLVYALIEVGAIAQNTHLARTALGMIGCDQAGYDKRSLELALGCDGTTRHAVHLTLMGHGRD